MISRFTPGLRLGVRRPLPQPALLRLHRLDPEGLPRAVERRLGDALGLRLLRQLPGPDDRAGRNVLVEELRRAALGRLLLRLPRSDPELQTGCGDPKAN